MGKNLAQSAKSFSLSSLPASLFGRSCERGLQTLTVKMETKQKLGFSRFKTQNATCLKVKRLYASENNNRCCMLKRYHMYKLGVLGASRQRKNYFKSLSACKRSCCEANKSLSSLHDEGPPLFHVIYQETYRTHSHREDVYSVYMYIWQKPIYTSILQSRKGKRQICFSMDNNLKVNPLSNQDSYNRIALQSGWL